MEIQKFNISHLYERKMPKKKQEFEMKVATQEYELEEGEILIIFPKYNFIERFFRPNANANTILLTENCDQKCIMCSQPPKNKDYLYFDLYEKACVLLPMNTFIVISGAMLDGSPEVINITFFCNSIFSIFDIKIYHLLV